MNEQLKEAMNYLKGGNLFGELSNEALESVEKLIGKATPMKPIYLSWDQYKCLSCRENFDLSSFNKRRGINKPYCDYCGQKFDWSDHDDNSY